MTRTPHALYGTLVGVALIGALMSACSNSQLAATQVVADKYSAAIDNFNAAVKIVNVEIVAKTSATVAGYCTDLEAAGKNLVKIVQGNDTAATVLNKSATALSQFCAAPPQDVGAAVVQLTAMIAAAKAAGG